MTRGSQTQRGLTYSAVYVGTAVVLALVAAHCLAGFAVYSGSRGGVRLLQVGSLSLTSVSPVLVQQAAEQSWSQAVEPSQQSLDAEGEAMLADLRATSRLKQQVKAVMQVEAAYNKPQPHESLEQLLRPPPPGQQPTMLLQTGTGNGISALGVPAPDFRHFEAAGRGQGDDYYQAKFRYGGSAIRQQLSAMQRDQQAAAQQEAETSEEEATTHKRVRAVGARGRSATRQSLLEPNTYPKVGYPFEQTSIDSKFSNGPAKTFDTPPQITCPSFIPNCKPQLNSLTQCDFSCGSYCQAIRGDGPCLSGDSEGEGRDCKFGYRGASQTPSLADEEESGWLEKPSMWGKGGPKDCMTCPVGFKIKALYGDGTGPCIPCDEGWVDSDTGLIKEEGCGGGSFAKLDPGEEPGQALASEEFSVVAGCLPTPEVPLAGAQILAKVPDDLKEESFFVGYESDFYPAQILGTDPEEDKMAIKFADGGPFVGLDPGIDATALGEDFVALPKVGDKVTLSSEYWDSCCEEAYDASVAGPLRLGDVGEVTSALPAEADDPAPYTVLAPTGVRWMYGAGQVLPLIGEIKCSLPGLVKINTVGNEMNQLKEVADPPAGMAALPEDPECCCCTRDLWVGCWGWCGDGSDSTPTLAHTTPAFRAGEGALPGQVGGPCRGEYPLAEPVYPGSGAPRVDADPQNPDCSGLGRRLGGEPRMEKGKN